MFRAYSTSHNEIAFGFLSKTAESWYLERETRLYEVDINSLGMNTGKKDCQRNMIYGSVEVNGVMSRGGDIVTLRDLVDDSFRKQEFVVEYSNTRFRFVLDNEVNKKGYPLSMPDTSVTIIGNQFQGRKESL